MIVRRRPLRPGFTLLEVLLASAIGVLLLGGLYVAFDLTLRQTDAGREVVEHSDLARGIVHKMSIDLSGGLGLLQPKSGGGTQQQSGTTSSGGSTTSSSSTTTSTGTTGSTDSSGTTDTGSTSGTTTATADVPFQGGVFGTDKQLTLFVSRVPPALTTLESAAGTGVIDSRPDLRRVTYYLGSGGGLCRQEKPWVTADGVRNSTDPDLTDEPSDLISDEVLDVTFEYFDGSAWATQWTGSDTAADGVTLLGPPRAIRVTLVIQPGGPNSGAAAKTVVHVFAVRAAVGLYQPTTDGSTGTSGTTTTTGGM